MAEFCNSELWYQGSFAMLRCFQDWAPCVTSSCGSWSVSFPNPDHLIFSTPPQPAAQLPGLKDNLLLRYIAVCRPGELHNNPCCQCLLVKLKCLRQSPSTFWSFLAKSWNWQNPPLSSSCRRHKMRRFLGALHWLSVQNENECTYLWTLKSAEHCLWFPLC